MAPAGDETECRQAESDDDTPRRLPLHEEHKQLGAKFSPFGGWRMPVTYSSIIEEHFRVRTHAGLFDVSHMGRFLLRGRDALRTVQRLVASDVSVLQTGEARYTVLLTPWGGIRDDLIVYRRDDGVLLIVNAGSAEGDRAWIEDHLVGDATLDDITDITCLFALQGPHALTAIASITSCDPGGIAPFTFVNASVAGVEATIMRTGYTGEDGVELMVQHTDALRLWRETLIADRQGDIAPCGLGARDTLRLEASLLLYGRDLDQSTVPYEARLGRLTHLERADGSDFVGREALLEAQARGPSRLLVGLATDARAIPRAGDTIVVEGEVVGVVTSGSLSPVLGHPIALGYVTPEMADVGRAVTVVSTSKTIPARVVDRPFYKRGITPIPERPRRGASTQRPATEDAL
ncbi:MAG: glycine cleavage system aminomethyltransferase GcvT [Actinobacteria bacterium]|nr:glycine cleavage system aminomethyltransferase GcvT [Actinomycetota bacterium]